MMKMYLLLFLVLILGSVGAGAYKYYQTTQETIRILTENNVKLEMAAKTQEEAIASLQANYAAAQEENNALNEKYSNIRRQNQLLADKLSRIDLTAAAVSNPEGIGRAVNRGTINAGRCFELLSGAELTEEERTAENDIAFNKECPWLYDDYKSRGMLSDGTAEGDSDQQ